jgi:phage shock protein E
MKRKKRHPFEGPADELALLIDQGAPPPILDVRYPKEYAAGHVPGAINIPFNKVRKRLTEVPRIAGQPLVIYCAHGPRAWMARRTLRNKGVEPLILLKGHWRSWIKQGHPVES